MKVCSACQTNKSLNEFYSDASKRDGKATQCKHCVNAKKTCDRNRARIRSAEYYKRNKEKIDAKNRAWREANPERVKEVRDAYYEDNKHEIIRKVSERQRDILYRPTWCRFKPWSDAIKQKYTECSDKTRDTGVEHQVDHIIPLNNPHVCGLHVPWNLQVITQFENGSKHNKWTPWWDTQNETE